MKKLIIKYKSMMTSNTRYISYIFTAYILSASISSSSFATTMLTLPGAFEPPGIVGTFPATSSFSWLTHKRSTDDVYHSWMFGGGTDGGVVFNQSQSYGEMTDVFKMYNQTTSLFSVDSGITISDDNTIDMSNLRLRQSASVYDLGSGSGYDTFIPYVDDITTLKTGQNGWGIAGDEYHLLYNTIGICDTCEITIHMYGTAIVPVPAALWLFITGIIMLFSYNINRK